MIPKVVLLALSFASVAWDQLVGTYQTETHPSLPFQRCTKSGGCTAVSAGQVVLDSNWRWVHAKDGYSNCYNGNAWNATICPDGVTCAANCALDGADYPGTYGITTSGNALTLKFVTTNTNGKNIGSRVYLMSSDSKYELFKVFNQEFTFDVDVSLVGLTEPFTSLRWTRMVDWPSTLRIRPVPSMELDTATLSAQKYQVYQRRGSSDGCYIRSAILLTSFSLPG